MAQLRPQSFSRPGRRPAPKARKRPASAPYRPDYNAGLRRQLGSNPARRQSATVPNRPEPSPSSSGPSQAEPQSSNYLADQTSYNPLNNNATLSPQPTTGLSDNDATEAQNRQQELERLRLERLRQIELQRRRNRLARQAKVAKKASNRSSKLSLDSLLSDPRVAKVSRRIPRLKAMLTALSSDFDGAKKKKGKKKIKALKSIKNRLFLLKSTLTAIKTGVGIAEGLVRWGQAFMFTLITIIIPIILLIALPIVIVFAAVIGGPLAWKIRRIIGKIDEVSKEVNKTLKNEIILLRAKQELGMG